MRGAAPPTWVLPALDHDAAERAKARQQVLTKPRDSLGRLEEIPAQLAAIQGTHLPTARPAAAILFAADHPVCRHGVSAYPSEVTAAMVRNFVAGGAAASVAAAAMDVALHVVDVGVTHSYAEVEGSAASVYVDPVAAEPEGDIRIEDGLRPETLVRAIAAGAAAVDRLEPGTRVVCLGEMGIGNTTLASAVACALLGKAPSELVGRGTGLGDAALSVKRRVVEDALGRLVDRSPLQVLQSLGGREVAALYGAAARACELGMAVLVDGFIVSVAMLVLARTHPAVTAHFIYAHRSREHGHTAVLEALGARPLLDLSMALGEGSGALAALPLVDLACRLHADMATFEEARVPDGDR